MGWTRQVKGGETCLDGELRFAPALGSYGPGVEEVAAEERRKALPWPLFPGDPGNKLRSLHYQGAPFGVPPPSLLIESEVP